MRTGSRLSHLTDVVVVGGGIAGCTVGYELARRGVKVTILEERSIAAGASGRNMGLLLNQVEPEVVRIMHRSLAVYQELVGGEIDFQLRRHDQLLLGCDPAQLAASGRRASAIEALGISSRSVDPPILAQHLAPLRLRALGGHLLEGAWALDPDAATRAFAEAARRAGAEIRAHTRVVGLAVASGRVEGVLTNVGSIPADAVVLATGPWLPELAPEVAVVPARGWLMKTGRLGFNLPWIVEEMSWPDQDELGRAARSPSLAEVAKGGHDLPVAQAFVIAPIPGGTSLIGTSLAPSLREPVEGVDMPQRIARRALEVAPGLADVPITAAWYGMRPMTPDGMPVAGALGPDGLYVHGGHGSIGMMTAPAIAGWLAAHMLGDEVGSDLDRLTPRRFEGSSGT